MSQVSKYKLDKDLETEMFRQFWVSLTRLRDASTVSSFFTDLLTDMEEMVLAKRFTVAILLLRGKKPVDIKSTLHVSFSTITSVSSWVKNAKPKTKQVMESIIKDGNWQSILDRVEELLDAAPPMYHTDWTQAGKDKWRRKMERSTRQSLR